MARTAGREAIPQMFVSGFASAKMIRIAATIFDDDQQ
jgi:hypothetical protein